MKKLMITVFTVALLLLGSRTATANSLSSSISTESPYQLDFEGGMIVGNGNSAIPGVDAKVTAKLNTSFPVYVGGELGIFFANAAGQSAAVIPILGTVYTPVAVTSRFGLRLGMSVGPVIATSGNFSTAGLAVLFDPTLLFDLGSGVALNLEPRFGWIGAGFVAIPQIGLTFYL